MVVAPSVVSLFVVPIGKPNDVGSVGTADVFVGEDPNTLLFNPAVIPPVLTARLVMPATDGKLDKKLGEPKDPINVPNVPVKFCLLLLMERIRSCCIPAEIC